MQRGIDLKYGKQQITASVTSSILQGKGIGKIADDLQRQTMFVEKAQCETTERKFKEYLLKPGAKHAKEFFDVGYAKENPIQLRYDIAKQYDESKVQNVIELEDGSKKYSIPMKLGITEKKQFLTCWIKEPGNGKPRITTAYRKDADK